LQPGWIWLQAFEPEITALGQAWCTNNKPHANAMLQRLGGPVLACQGWCPQVDVTAGFDDGDAKGWTSYAGCSGYDNPASPVYGENARLGSRRGRGYLRSAEQAGGGEDNCDPSSVYEIEMNRYYDIDLSQAGFGPGLHLSGFTRSFSTYSGASAVTNRCVKLIDLDTQDHVVSKCQAFPQTTDTGWVPFNFDFTAAVADLTKVRIVIGMYDNWGSDWSQEVHVDEVRICTAGSKQGIEKRRVASGVMLRPGARIRRVSIRAASCQLDSEHEKQPGG